MDSFLITVVLCNSIQNDEKNCHKDEGLILEDNREKFDLRFLIKGMGLESDQ